MDEKKEEEKPEEEKKEPEALFKMLSNPARVIVKFKGDEYSKVSPLIYPDFDINTNL